jgi:hypothetical protein
VAKEWTLLEALESGAASTGALEIAGQRFARSVAAFVAPLLALVACALAGSGVAGYLALPAACATLLVFDVALRAFLGGIAVTTGGGVMVARGLGMGLVAAFVLALGLGRRAPALLRPVNERA